MRRRTLVTSLAGATFAPAIAARAQQRPALPVIGSLGIAPNPPADAVFLNSLKDGGYVEGRNVAIERRYERGRPDMVPGYAAELVALKVAVIVATTVTAALAARDATQTIPIVFLSARPIELGLVTSYSRPGGNLTGVDIFLPELMPKRLELVRDLLPAARSVAWFFNPDGPNAANERVMAEAAARATGQELQFVALRNAGEIEQAFARFTGQRPDAIVSGAHPLFFAQRQQIIALAARHAIPAIYEWPLAVAEGGLIALGPNLFEAVSIAGNYTARILAGARPGDLPVQRLSKFALSINLGTARALGLTVPPALLSRADEVIE